mmetsp:Transcript_2193/g.6731  ORF Transcript_2193/g.6731 Transcript_2193/m.6731 type:complete len:460 (+) Transcript_2193:156-1535(+)
MRLVCLAASFAVAAARTVQNEEERYVRRWADNGSRARCDAPSCSWIEAFGPVDVGCRITVDRVGLDDAKGPELTLKFADGSKLALAAATAAGVDRFATRPALCEYAPRGGGEKPGVALLMVANSPAYLFRLWPPFLNKLLYAADAGLRPFLWLGELPEALEHPTNPECLNSKTVALRDLPKGARRLRSFYDHRAGAGDDRDVARVSNHYVKMPAALAALAAPGVSGLYYVDLDAVTAWPWTVDPGLLSEHRNGFSDVTFQYGYDINVPAAENANILRWKVHGSRFYVRDTPKGRAFFSDWFANRCTFKDQYSLWHTILEFAAKEGCVDYRGEIYSEFRYRDAKHVKPQLAAERFPEALVLDCARVDKHCPRWSFANVGGEKCALLPPNVVDQIYHHTIPSGGSGTFHLTIRGADFVVENACFATGFMNRSKCLYVDDMDAYLAKLGLPGRDRVRHPWGG